MAEPLLRARGLSRRFGGLVAVDRVSIDLHPGEIHAVIGTNGAGKSTLVELLSGGLAPSAGEIVFGGRPVGGWPQAARARAGIGRSYQRTTIFPSFSVFENCRLCAQAKLPGGARLWRVWEGAAGCAASNAAAREAIAATGLDDVADREAGTLSHGRQRQLEIAMVLATRPRVLLLDEPLAGMGAEETGRLLALFLALKPGRALLLVEHDMDAVFRVADRITVMVDGQAVASGPPEAIRADPVVRAAYLGEDDAAALPTP